ncbi:TPA: DNA repair protein [Streptococcus suis]
MSKKQLRQLRRIDLLELVVSQAEEIEKLQEQVKSLQDKLNDRQIVLAEAGSIAEAALKLNHVFEAAQAAAEQYLYNVRYLSETKATDTEQKVL